MRDRLVRTKRLALPLAAAFHIGAATLLYVSEKAGWISQHFQDADFYSDKIIVAATILRSRGVSPWFFSLLPLHVKLYSLVATPFVPSVKLSSLVLEPLNLFYYIAILYLLFTLGRRMFDEQTGLLAGAIVAVWPSFLVFTMQSLKDPLFITLTLALLSLNSLLLTRSYLAGKISLIVLGALITQSVLWIVRSDMWYVMIAVELLTCAALLIQMTLRRRWYLSGLTGAAILLCASVVLPSLAVSLYGPAIGWARERNVAFLPDTSRAESSSVDSDEAPISSPATKVSRMRQRFANRYPGAASNIDVDVRLASAFDVVRYLPRAALIGFCAPFPNLWFETGRETGRRGRALAGFETAALYLIEVFAIAGLWYRRSDVVIWWLLAVILTGCVALGLVVTNVGALYRMRDIFVMLIVIMGSYGFRRLLLYRAANEHRGPFAAVAPDRSVATEHD